VVKRGRPLEPHARRSGLFIRFSDTEMGALERALQTENPIAARRPTMSAWLRDLAVAHATEVLQVEVTRSGLRHLTGGVPDWKRWKLARAVRRAATRRRGRKKNGARRAP
jgi:hypothetical protein